VYQTKMYGLGGQGVVTASEILVHAAVIHEQKYARSLPAYGHERRGAPVFADVMIDDSPILLSSFVYESDYVLLFDPAVVDMGVDIQKGAGGHTTLLVNTGDPLAITHLVQGVPWKAVYHVDATRIAHEISGSQIPNAAMLGAFARTGIVSVESVCYSLRENLGSERSEANVRVAREAYDQVERL
jgi:pyruvate ferredoxin oxidoreductase gamma subunit